MNSLRFQVKKTGAWAVFSVGLPWLIFLWIDSIANRLGSKKIWFKNTKFSKFSMSSKHFLTWGTHVLKCHWFSLIFTLQIGGKSSEIKKIIKIWSASRQKVLRSHRKNNIFQSGFFFDKNSCLIIMKIIRILLDKRKISK